MFSVRFVKDFEITVNETVLDDNGNMVSKIKKHNIAHGDIHLVDRRVVHPNTVDIVFHEKDIFGKCFALSIPKGYCEFMLPSSEKKMGIMVKKKRGCGGCGRKK